MQLYSELVGSCNLSLREAIEAMHFAIDALKVLSIVMYAVWYMLTL